MADYPRSEVAAATGEDQLAPAATAAAGPATVSAAPHAEHHGRPVSWVAVVTITLGFLIGGAGLVFGPTWWLFWLGTGLAAVGGIVALGTGIFNDWY
jgi:hypothetical protein